MPTTIKSSNTYAKDDTVEEDVLLSDVDGYSPIGVIGINVAQGQFAWREFHTKLVDSNRYVRVVGVCLQPGTTSVVVSMLYVSNSIYE